jgi:hypothetical protein
MNNTSSFKVNLPSRVMSKGALDVS